MSDIEIITVKNGFIVRPSYGRPNVKESENECYVFNTPEDLAGHVKNHFTPKTDNGAK